MKAKWEKQMISSPTWCAACCIRVAPADRHTESGGKTYHALCYNKLRQQQLSQQQVRGA
jgi:hypothetical protein